MAKVSVKRHLKELQWRLMIVAVFFIAGAALAYSYQAQIVPSLLAPLNGAKLVYLNPAGGFSFVFLVSIYAGIAMAFPILIQQLYAFLRPALPVNARKKSSIIIVSSFLLLAAGIIFGYLVAVPNALNFLYSFADKYVEASLTADSYLNFLIAYTIGIGIVFQLPLLLLLINLIKPFTPGGLLKSEKWVVLVAFIVAAIITPTPDPINQAIIAGPVVVVYQIGVIAILIGIARKNVAKKQAARRLQRQEKLASKRAKRSAATNHPIPQPQPAAAPIAQIVPQPVVRQAVAIQPAQAPPVPMQHKVIAQPARPVVPVTQHQHTPTTIKPARPVRSVDGFMRTQPSRRPIPQRTAVQPRPTASAAAQQQQRTSLTPAFYIDSVVAPRRVNGF